MKYTNIIIVFVLFFTDVLFAARTGTTTVATVTAVAPQQGKRKPVVQPRTSRRTATKIPITQQPVAQQFVQEKIKSYEQMLNTLKIITPSAVDYPVLRNIEEEIDRQIKALQISAQIKPEVKLPDLPVIKPKLPIIKPDLPIIKPDLPVIKSEQPSKIVGTLQTYLVPTSTNILRRYDLCPLFTEPALYFVFKESRLLSSGKTSLGFEGDDVDVNAPCTVALGKFGAWDRTLMQLKSLNQFELSAATGLDPALCAGHSLNNGRLIRKYALTNDAQCLKDLHNLQSSANFLLDLNIGAWLNVEVVRAKIAELRQELGVDGVDVSAVSTVSLFDSHLNKKFGFSVFDENEFTYVQDVKKNIQQGLKKKNYVHIMIIGNEETVEEAFGHYFCFAIIKKGNTIQYVVLDTAPRAYHLHAGSHERDRLMFVIQNIEQGNSAINVANIRTKRLQIMEEDRLQSLE